MKHGVYLLTKLPDHLIFVIQTFDYGERVIDCEIGVQVLSYTHSHEARLHSSLSHVLPFAPSLSYTHPPLSRTPVSLYLSLSHAHPSLSRHGHETQI